MAGQVLNYTNQIPGIGPTVTLCSEVPWSMGQMPDIATLRNTRAIRVGNTIYPTFWHARGAPYQEFDGQGNVLRESLRYTYAMWNMTVDPGSATPSTWTHNPVVVATDNSATAGTENWQTWVDDEAGDGLDITIAYTDVCPEIAPGTTAVSVNIAQAARDGDRGTTYSLVDAGGLREITMTAWIGPGRHHLAIQAHRVILSGANQFEFIPLSCGARVAVVTEAEVEILE